MLDTSKLYKILGRLEFISEIHKERNIFLGDSIRHCYDELCDILNYPSIFKQEEQQEEQEKEFITLVEDKDLSSSKIIQGYAFLTSTGECLCEYIYFKEENKLEIYNLEELNTKYFINTSINEIKSIIEGIFYWGVY